MVVVDVLQDRGCGSLACGVNLVFMVWHILRMSGEELCKGEC